MRECSPKLPSLANAAIDSMGGVVDDKGGIGTNLSPQHTIVEETKAELRQHYDFFEKARRQLEFLEQGGDPLDFRLRHAASLSVQSTSLTDQQPEQFVISEAKGSFALAASPPGDSVESSGRPGAPAAYEPNSADNLMLFDGENDVSKGERSLLHSSRNTVGPSEQASQLEVSQNAKESGDSSAFGLPKKAYRRRNRSRPSRDVARSSSTDVLSSGGHNVFPSRHVPREAKGLSADDNQRDRTVSSNSNLKSTSPNSSIAPKAEPSKIRLDVEVDGVQAIESTITQTKGRLSDVQKDANALNDARDNQHTELVESNAKRTPNEMALSKPESHKEREQVPLGQECDPSLAMAKVDGLDTGDLTNGFSSEMGDKKGTKKEVQNKNAVLDSEGVDSELFGKQAALGLNGDINSENCTNLRSIGSNGYTKDDTPASEVALNKESHKSVEEDNETRVDNISAVANADNSSFHRHQDNGSSLRDKEIVNDKLFGAQCEAKDLTATEEKERVGVTSLEEERMPSNLFGSNTIDENENAHSGRSHCSVDCSAPEIRETKFSSRASAISPERQTCSQDLKLESMAHEDYILEEARVIEANHKSIAELSVQMLRPEGRQKSHWDFVLEEMPWLANDFAQERLWKISAAAQVSRHASYGARIKFAEQNMCLKQKQVSHVLAKAVMDFWCLVEETSKEQELGKPGKDLGHAVQGYALRFLQYNSSNVQSVQAEVCTTPSSMSNLDILDMSWEDHLTEEILFYAVPAGAMDTYRKSIESHISQLEKTGTSMQEEAETSGYDDLAEYGFHDNAFEEDEGETSTYYLPGTFEGSKPSKLTQKRKKESAGRSYEMGSYLPFSQFNENKAGNHQSVIIGKRPANNLNVSIPTKRVRTATRQRVLSPFNAGSHGYVQAPTKTSSGDTNSFQDDQSILQGGANIPNSVEVESVRDFEKQQPFDSTEISHKPKKKKKKTNKVANNMGSTYDHKWQSDSNFQYEQRENFKRRLDGHHFGSNGSSGLYGQHIGKKPKIMKQSRDNSVDNSPANCSISSPVASQMSNMSNPNKFMKLLGGRDRGRKTKTLKTTSGQPGSGIQWSLFEDQALVVLVHDMGPNWDLVSDAFNSTLKFKCIFRKPKECKERHKLLMDNPAGEGADSGDDSGSSQPYQSTLTGIPKGSARQLFQHLQGPMEEDTIKSHLEKIIAIGKKQHHRRTQDPRQLQQPHNSHTFALSQVCPNNLNGGPILTPLDLCDVTASGSDVSLGYQSPHTSGLPIPNQGIAPPMLPASGVNPSVQSSASVAPGSKFSSPSGQNNASLRDGRSCIPRSASFSTDEQQRLQQYNQMVSGRNFQQSTTPASGVHPGTDSGVRMLTGGNGVGVHSGLNRSIPMPRPGLQGIASSSMLSPGSMLSSGMMAMPDPVNIHSAPGASQGNCMTRPRDPMHMMRPTQNTEHQRQAIMPELQMQVSQGYSQGISPFGGLSSSFSNQTTPPSVPSYPLHHQQPHPLPTQQTHVLGNSHHPHLQGPNLQSNTQQQAYAIRLAKERRIQQQQRLLQQHQQQQFTASNALMPRVPGQSQLTVSSPQNTSQTQTSSPPVSISPLTASSSPMSQHSQKHHSQPHIVGRNPQVGGILNNQVGKQRQRQLQQQQFQQSGRQHPQQRYQSQSQHQAKMLKGVGRGNMSHQSLPADNTHPLPNGPSTISGSQSSEKGEQNLHTVQGQGPYSAPELKSIQPQKQLGPSHTSHQPQSQQKLYSAQTTSSKQHVQSPAHSDSSNQNHVLPVVAGPTSTSTQAVPSNQQQHQRLQPQLQPKLVNQTQATAQRLLHHNRQVNNELQKRSLAREAQAGPNLASNFSQIASATPVTGSVEVGNVVSSISSVSSPQRPALEQACNSNMSNPATPMDSAGSSPFTDTANEPLLSVPQGTEQIQSSGSLPHVGQYSDVQSSEEPSQLQAPASPPPLQQQQEELIQQQSLEQSEFMQGGGSSKPSQLEQN